MSPLLTTFSGDSLRPYGFSGASASIPAFELISTIYGTGSSSSISFSSLPSIYTHFEIRYSTDANGSYAIRPNNISTASYSYHRISGTASGGAGAPGGTGTSSSTAGIYVGSGALNGAFTSGIIQLLDFGNTNKFKTAKVLAGNGENSQVFVTFIGGAFQSASAITSVTFYNTIGANFSTGSRFSLYGIRGA